MAVRIEYRPGNVSFDQFNSVDKECFPEEPILSEAFAEFLAKDFWGAYDSETLVGFGYVMRKPDIAWIARVGVAAAHRGKGIATRLMRAMIEHCQQIGLPDIMLYVQSDNDTAMRLYQRLGFKPAESAYQFVLPDPQQMLSQVQAQSIEAVPIVRLRRSSWPQVGREWSNIAEMHRPPEQYVLVFRDRLARSRGYCRLNPRFPGCFPFVVDRPSEDLLAALTALRGYLLPEKDVLKLTFSSDELANACTTLGLRLNYRLFKMLRSGGVVDSPQRYGG